MRLTRQRNTNDSSRRGSILLIVLVVIALLALAAYTFSETMIVEADAAAQFEKQVWTRTYADSGVEYVAAMLGQPQELGTVNYYHAPSLFQGVALRDTGTTRGTGRFSIVAPVENDVATSSIRFGLMNESGKLNLNQMLELELTDEELRTMLMAIPNMTEDVADAILDWIDDDDELREFGAEAETYESLDPPYTTKNGKLESLDELLKVAGVTPELLFGEDVNRNGLLDPNEDDGELTPPLDNADGILQLGWSAYLTIYSRESNLTSDGGEKIHVNNNLLTELYDELVEFYGDEEAAQFVVAYRMYGPSGATEEDIASINGTTGGAGGLTFENSQEVQRFAQGMAANFFRASAGDAETVTRGGMNLAGGAQVRINSVYDLVGAEVVAEVDGTSQTLTSPWSDDPGEMQTYLPELLDSLSPTSEPYVVGRININECRTELLYGLPSMTPEVADMVAASQMIGSDGEPIEETISTHATSGWLVMEGVVTLEEMRVLDRWVTTRGDVYRAQVIGFFDEGGPFARIEAIIDATQYPPAIVQQRDLSDLGRGYPQSLLSGTTTTQDKK